MLLAKVEQTDEHLVITPQKSVFKKRFAFVALSLAIIIGTYIRTIFSSRGVPVFATIFLVVFFIVVALLPLLQKMVPQWPEPAFIFDRTTRRVSRNGHFLGLFSNVLRVCLLTRVMKDGPWFRLVLVMTNFDEWKIIETSTQPLIAEQYIVTPVPWEHYPSDTLPTDATEYELVMLANLIHDYLGLPGSAPCRRGPGAGC